MPRRPSLIPKQDPSKIGTGSEWYVVTPPSLAADGKLKRTYFPTEEAAEKLAKKLRGQYAKGARHAVLDPILARDATTAANLLKDHHISLTDAARAYLSRVKASGKDETFKERYDRYVTANEMEWSTRYCRDMEALANKLPPSFLKMHVAEITEERIREAAAFRSEGQTAIDTRCRHIRAAIACKVKPRKKRPVKIFDEDQVEALLKACKEPEETYCVALMLFAGVRPDAGDGEMSKLLWEDVRGYHVHIREEVSKTGQDRLIPIKPRLRRLLKGKPKVGRIAPGQWKKRIQRIRKDAGIDGSKYQDSSRHTFASHFLAAYGETKTKDAMGHTQGSRTLFRHYRKAVTEAAGKAYFR